MAEGQDLDTLEKQEKFVESPEQLDVASDELDTNIDVQIHPSNVSGGRSLEDRFSPLKIFKMPLCLISTDQHGKLQVSDSVLSQIRQIDVRLNVVGVCGLYRSGKSYLMNRLAGENRGFALGSSTKSHTKGVWAWCKVHPKQDDQVLLLLDTEGLADIKKGNVDHDNQLFSLTLLLCSTLIYNMTSVFNQDALEKLTFITKLSEHVQVTGTNTKDLKDDSLMRSITPLFVLCLRDFYLDINVDEKEPTPDEYFEDCLKPENGPESDRYNKTRECIKTYFPNRKCFTISSPASGKKLRHLETLDDTQLDEDFVREIDEMRDFVYDQKYKRLDSVTQLTVDGTGFAQVTKMYVDKFREGSPIKYQDTFELIADQENRKIMEKILAEFDKDMENIPLPVNQKMSLQTFYTEKKERALYKFRESAYPFQKLDFEDKALENMQKKYEEIQLQNSQLVRRDCNKVLSDLYSEIVESHSEKYAVEDGYNIYKQNMIALEKEFNSKMKNVDADERMAVWQDLKYSKHDENMRIYAAATKLADEARYDAFRKDIEEKLRQKVEEFMEKLSTERRVDLMHEITKLQQMLYHDLELNKVATDEAIKTVKESKRCIVM